jgi:hypothetical protein
VLGAVLGRVCLARRRGGVAFMVCSTIIFFELNRKTRRSPAGSRKKKDMVKFCCLSSVVFYHSRCGGFSMLK